MDGPTTATPVPHPTADPDPSTKMNAGGQDPMGLASLDGRVVAGGGVTGGGGTGKSLVA